MTLAVYGVGYLLAAAFLVIQVLKDSAEEWTGEEWWLTKWVGGLSERWQMFFGLLYMALCWFVTKPFRFVLTAVVSWVVHHLTVLSLLPVWLQILAPPIIIFGLVVRFRGPIGSLTYGGQFVVLVLGYLFVVYGALTNAGDELYNETGKYLAWFFSFTWSSILIWCWVIPMTWLEEGNNLGFWQTVLRLGSVRMYGPEGNPNAEKPPRRQPFGGASPARDKELAGLL